MPVALQTQPADRLDAILRARRAVMSGDAGVLPQASGVAPWIERSWRRCLAQGRQPGHRVGFDAVSAEARARTLEASRPLIDAARPVLDRLSRAIASTRYFAILTDAQGIVVDTQGAIDRSDPRAAVIARVGVDLSERAVGTSAIGAALSELQPVWLHRGEHFFDDTSVYSCAGAPLFGPAGECVGMLDLTGVDAPERPELAHLVAESARGIENALLLRQPHALLLRLNWPGRTLGEESDGLVALDADGFVAGSNALARRLLPQPALRQPGRLHCSDLFALPWEMLFDSARRDTPAQDVPLWSGLRLSVLAQRSGMARAGAVPLREVETTLIRQAVADARGNVAEAARLLGISRATVYRKLGRKVR